MCKICSHRPTNTCFGALFPTVCNIHNNIHLFMCFGKSVWCRLTEEPLRLIFHLLLGAAKVNCVISVAHRSAYAGAPLLMFNAEFAL